MQARVRVGSILRDMSYILPRNSSGHSILPYTFRAVEVLTYLQKQMYMKEKTRTEK